MQNTVPSKIENVKETANTLRAIIKNMAKSSLTDEERKVVADHIAPRVSNNVVGEEYILPADVSTRIREIVFNSKSFRSILPTIKTGALSGSIPYDQTENIELADFVDGTAMSDSNNLSFRQVTFSLKEKGAIIALNNTLLQFTDNDLINFVANKFAKRALKTYNRMAVEALMKGKTVKTFADVKAVVKSAQVDLDLDFQGVIVTNQYGYQKLAEKEATVNGISYIQPDLSKPASLMIDGKPVIVFSKKQLENRVDGAKEYAPIFMGALDKAVNFVDAGKYSFALSSEAGFTTNQTLTRVIDYVDCMQITDSNDVYVVGEIEV